MQRGRALRVVGARSAESNRDVIRIDTQMLTPAPTVTLTGKHVIIDGKSTALVSTSAPIFEIGVGAEVTLERRPD